MLYFGSRNFGQANFGKGLITTAVDETLTTSNMDVAGYLLFDTCTVDQQAACNVDVAAGIQRLGYLNITPDTTLIASGIKMTWVPQMAAPKSTASTQVSGFIAWDSQLVDDATWTTQTVD